MHFKLVNLCNLLHVVLKSRLNRILVVKLLNSLPVYTSIDYNEILGDIGVDD